MSFEQSKFGDGVSTTKVTNVSNHFGGRVTGGVSGVVKTEGTTNEAVFDFTGADLSAGDFALETAFKLPAGAVVERVWFKVKEVFTITGTSATGLIGTNGSEVTNGFVVTEAQLEAEATYDLTSTLTGTWAAPLAAATTVGIALGGTTPTSAATGRAKVVIEYAVVGA